MALHYLVLILSLAVGLVLIVVAALRVRPTFRSVVENGAILFAALVCLRIAVEVMDMIQGVGLAAQ